MKNISRNKENKVLKSIVTFDQFISLQAKVTYLKCTTLHASYLKNTNVDLHADYV